MAEQQSPRRGARANGAVPAPVAETAVPIDEARQQARQQRRAAQPIATTTPAEVIGVPAFQVDPEVADEALNEARQVNLPYILPLGKQPRGGLFIPVDQLARAGWHDVDEDAIETLTITEEELEGLWLNDVRLVVLAQSPIYVTNKETGEYVGDYSRHTFDKDTQRAVGEFIIVLVNEDNHPLHDMPFLMRCRNAFLWSFTETLREFYTSLEMSFAKATNARFTTKSDKWRSLGVLELEITGKLVGPDSKNRSHASSIKAFTRPTVENLPDLFLGGAGDTERRNAIWGSYDMAAQSVAAAAEVPALPPGLIAADEVPGNLRSAAPADAWDDEDPDNIPY